jgi:hypothetical protein
MEWKHWLGIAAIAFVVALLVIWLAANKQLPAAITTPTTTTATA